MLFHVVDSEWTSNKCVEMKKTHMRDCAHEVCRFMTSSSPWQLSGSFSINEGNGNDYAIN